MDASLTTSLIAAVLCIMTADLFSKPVETLCFEAEMANRIEPMMEIAEDAGCSGGRALVIRQGAGGEQARANGNGRAFYVLRLAYRDAYSVWLRARWLDACSNSILVVAPAALRGVAMDPIYGRWHWVRVAAWRGRVRPGVQVLILGNREDGVAIDQIAVSNDPDFRPSGIVSCTCVPGAAPLPGCVADVEASISARGGDFPPRPPRHADVSHKVSGPGQLPDFHPLCPALPGIAGRLILWLRNNTSKPASVRWRLRADTALGFGPIRRGTRGVPAQGLIPVTFQFTPGADLAISEHVVGIDYEWNGLVLRKRVDLVRPFAWQMVGPFRHRSGRTIEFPHPPETEPAAAGYAYGGERLHWSNIDPRKVCTPFAFVDLGCLYGNPNWTCAYARTQFDLDAEGDVLVTGMGDDAVRVWIDGRAVLTAEARLPAMLNRAVTRVHLRRGRHELHVKSCQTVNYWEFYVGLHPAPGERCRVRGAPFGDFRPWSVTPLRE